jgi:hypothetical protein
MTVAENDGVEIAQTRSEIAEQMAEQGEVCLEVSPRRIHARKMWDEVEIGDDVTSDFRAGPDNDIILFVENLTGDTERAYAALIDDSVTVHGLASGMKATRREESGHIQLQVDTLEIL